MKTETVPVDSLVFDPANARKHGEKNLAAIKGSLQRFGQQKPIVVDAKGIVRAGNGTLAALIALGWKDAVIVRSSLSGSEATAYAIADNRTAELAEWDTDVLSQTLAALQIESEDLAEATGFEGDDLDELLGNSSEDENVYTTKIRPPIYEITGEKPSLGSLADQTKTKQLLAAIEAAELPADVAEFLRISAMRHTVFNFQRIAEFYAHSDLKTQDLMEKSALVIIDFDKAVENGFVELTAAIGELVEKEKESNDA